MCVCLEKRRGEDEGGRKKRIGGTEGVGRRGGDRGRKGGKETGGECLRLSDLWLG